MTLPFQRWLLLSLSLLIVTPLWATGDAAATAGASSPAESAASGRASSAPSSAADSTTSAPDLKVFVVDPRGRTTTTYVLPADQGMVRDVLFRYRVPAPYRNYTSWALDISDPPRHLITRVTLDGPLPALLHWDGYFGTNQSIRAARHYFYRLLLVLPDRVVASNWSVFFVQAGSVEQPLRSASDTLQLQILPSGGAYGVILRTKSMRSSLALPSLYGDVRAIWRRKYIFGGKFEATSNILFGQRTGPTDFAYSDFSLFMAYRFVGEAMRAPMVPATPPYDPKAKNQPLPSGAYGKSTNLEIGARFYDTVVRGYGGQPLDYEAIRQIAGLSGTLHADQSLGPLRLMADLEAGYSVFRGKVLSLSGQATLLYDHLSISPGLQARVLYFRGTAVDDAYEGPAPAGGYPVQRVNELFFLGAVLYFKL